MKRALFSIFLLLGVISIARAHDQPPIIAYVQSSEMVCVAKVTGVKNNVLTFTVEEIVKGRPPTVLLLSIGEVPVGLSLNSEWLLASTGKKQDSVGWAIEGDYGWVNAPIQRIDGQIHLMGKYGYVDKSLEADPSKGLTLDQLKALAKTPLPKN